LKKLLIIQTAFILAFFLLANPIVAQQDSTSSILKGVSGPSILMVSGVVLNKKSTKENIQEKVTETFPGFHTSLDDYFMYAPSALNILATVLDKKENNLKQLSDIVIAELGMYVTMKSLKKITKTRRPNGGGQSFPSGHTTQAFTGATLLFHHYKDKNIWLANSGFLFAIATGTFRVINNEHWASDVVFGSGLGMLVGTLTYHFNPLGKSKKAQNVNLGMALNGFKLQIKF
jgi:hypothetical protein